ncbi:hypothetical protein TNCV_2184021 [Trichonephila clavipes]|nr:hypothetical protein TNCV_2184021 [Trichonephila clavipes]
MDRDYVQELLDSHNQELTIDELIEMHGQEQNIEELESLDSVQLDRMTVGNSIEGLSLVEKRFQILENIDSNDERIFSTKQPVGVVIRRGVPDQVSSTSLDHGSKLRGPSPKALV